MLLDCQNICRRLWLAAVPIALFAAPLSGCGSPEGAAAGAGLAAAGASTQALRQDDLTGSCSGRWAYRTARCGQVARRPECGIESEAVTVDVPHFHPCRRAEFGVETWQVQARHTYITDGFNIPRGAGCEMMQQGGWHFQAQLAIDRCEEEWRAHVLHNIGPSGRVQCINPKLADCRETGWPKRTYFTYHVEAIVLIPLYREQHGSHLCPPSGRVESRVVEPRRYRACPHPANGPETAQGCTGALTFSDPGLSRADLDARIGAPAGGWLGTCTTCDAGDVTHAAARGGDRLACLEDSWQEFFAADATPETRDALSAELREALGQARGEVL